MFNLADQNIATGNPGPLTGGGLDEQATGNEYFVWLYPDFDASSPTRAAVYKHIGPSNFSFLGYFPLTVLADGYTATIPLSTFSDDGLLNFKVTSSKQLSTNGFTGLLDSAPDVGLAPGTITPDGVGPNHQSVTNMPGTMHFLNGPPDQRVAQVITPTSSGFLAELRARFDICTVTVQVQGVTAGQPDGTVLMPAQTFAPSQMQTASDPFKTLVFSSPAMVAAGTPVAIVLDAPFSCGVTAGPNANFYSGGSAFFSLAGGPWFSFGAENDIAFQVKIKP